MQAFTNINMPFVQILDNSEYSPEDIDCKDSGVAT